MTSHTSTLPISQGIMVTPSGRSPSVRYSPYGSSIECESRNPDVCIMRELRVAWREKRPALLVQERTGKLSRSTISCKRDADVGSETKIKVNSKLLIIEFQAWFFRVTMFSHWEPNPSWWALETFEHSSSILETKSWGVLTERGFVQCFWIPPRGFSGSFVKLNHFSSAFVNAKSLNVSKKIVVRKSPAPKVEAKKAKSANIDREETPRPSISAAEWVFEIVCLGCSAPFQGSNIEAWPMARRSA